MMHKHEVFLKTIEVAEILSKDPFTHQEKNQN